jgi:hypothetical protein
MSACLSPMRTMTKYFKYDPSWPNASSALEKNKNNVTKVKGISYSPHHMTRVAAFKFLSNDIHFLFWKPLWVQR